MLLAVLLGALLLAEAFGFLEVAYQERAGLLIFINAFPNFKNIRSDPRYADLLRRIGLRQ